ncbi:MAG: S4 domain-containing protein [Gammaproteobacteria bacterium]
MTEAAVRLDKWLWAARFYKTRALAVAAVNGGHVHVNGLRVKPAREVHVGDELRISKTPYVYTLTVRALSGKRGPASSAQTLYEEQADSLQQREALAAQRKLLAAAHPQPARRPDKRERRKIIRFINKNQTG